MPDWYFYTTHYNCNNHQIISLLPKKNVKIGKLDEKTCLEKF